MDYKLYIKYILSIILGLIIGLFLSNNCLNTINTVSYNLTTFIYLNNYLVYHKWEKNWNSNSRSYE